MFWLGRLFRSKRKGSKKPKPRPIIPYLEHLENRLAPVVGAFGVPAVIAPRAPLQPASQYDGVVAKGAGTGSLIQTGTGWGFGHQILTSAHGIDNGDNQLIRFDLQRAGAPIPININVPANVPGGAQYQVRHSGYAYPLNDIGICLLVDQVNPAPDRLLVAPYTAQQYSMYNGPANEVGQQFTMVGYGRSGTGATGENIPRGSKRVGQNRFDSTGVPYNATYTMRLMVDFDRLNDPDGLPNIDPIGTLYGIADAGLGAAEALGGTGDSGSPAFVGANVIAGVFSSGIGPAETDINEVSDASFGELGFYTNVRMTIGDAALQNVLNPTDPMDNAVGYHLVLDMNQQILGQATDAAGRLLPIENITITTQVNGQNLELIVSGSGAEYLNGTYYSAPVANINSLTIRGGRNNETFKFIGNLGLEDIAVIGRAGNDTLDLTAITSLGNRFHFNGSDGTNTVKAMGDWDFTLRNTDLRVQNLGTVTLANVHHAELIGGPSDNNFTVSGWTGTANIDGQGGVDTIISTKNGDFTLADNLLSVAPGGTFNLASIERGELTGGSGRNQFTVSGWTGAALLDGRGGQDTIISSNDADISLSNNLLSRSTGGSFNLISIEKAELTGGVGNNSFFLSWDGYAQINGGQNNDQVIIGGNNLELELLNVEDLRITAGNVDLRQDAVVKTLVMTGGSLGRQATLAVTETGIWSGGLLEGNGELVIAQNATLEITGGDLKRIGRYRLRNLGTVNWMGFSEVRADRSRIQNFGEFNLFGEVKLLDDRRRSTFENEGTFRKSSPGGARFEIEEFRNFETILIDEGSFSLMSDLRQEAGRTIIAQDATMFLGMGLGSGRIFLRGGALGGKGRIVGNVTSVRGNLFPGLSPTDDSLGKLTIWGDYRQSDAGQFVVQLRNPTPSTGHDQLEAWRVRLAGRLWLLPLPGFAGNQFIIINNTGNAAVEGTFQGLPEGTVVEISGQKYRITYRGGDGNDVVLEQVNQPPVLNPIGNQLAALGCPVIFTATATDPDLPAQNLTFSLVGAPAGAGIDPISGEFFWLPTLYNAAAGNYSITVRVTDDGDPSLYDEETITITVYDWIPYVDNNGSFAFVPGPGPETMGISFLMDAPNLGDKVFLGTLAYNGFLLSSFSTFTYSTYVVQAQGLVAPYLNLYLDLNGDGLFDQTNDNLIVYDPSLNLPGVQKGVWQTNDAAAGSWYGFIPNGTIVGLQTLGQIAANPNYPNARIIGPWGYCTPGVVIVGGSTAGAGWTNFMAYVDHVIIEAGGTLNTYDFENALVPLASATTTAPASISSSSTGDFEPLWVQGANLFSTPFSWGRVGENEPSPRQLRSWEAVAAVFSRWKDDDPGNRPAAFWSLIDRKEDSETDFDFLWDLPMEDFQYDGDPNL